MSKRILIPLVDGFEEIEAITSIDLLRRAGLNVTTAGIGKLNITGSHGISVKADTTFKKAVSESFDAILLPGGPGWKQLDATPGLHGFLHDFAQQKKLIAAICAAPAILAHAGIVEGRQVTSFPSLKGEMKKSRYSTDPVVVDGNFITSRGAGTAVPFALAVIEALLNKKKSNGIAKEIQFPY